MPLFAVPRERVADPVGAFWFSERTRVLHAHREAAGPARELARRLGELRAPEGAGRPLRVAAGSGGADAVVLRRAAVPGGAEAFRLAVRPRGAVAEAADPAGLRLAARALAELFEPAGFLPGGRLADRPAHGLRALLVHLSHYDPVWWRRKRREKPVDLAVAGRVVRAAAAARFNALVVDVADGLAFRSHPELRRRYSITMEAFKGLVRLARSLGLEVIPKLNFAQSFRKHRHNHWMRPYDRLLDTPEYYRRAFALIGELLAATRPRLFHIGMDEDEEHTAAGYVEKVRRLRDFLAARGVGAVQWIDLNKPWQKPIEAKMRAAVGRLPQDVILAYWHYYGRRFAEVAWLRARGYRVLGATGGAGGRDPEHVRAFAQRAAAAGAMGMISTHWVPLQPRHEASILRSVEVSGRAFWQGW